MKYSLFLISVVFLIFFNTKVPAHFGFSGGLNTLSFLPFVVHFAIGVFTKKIQYGKNAVYVILLAVVIIIFKWTIRQSYIDLVVVLLIIPMLISMSFENLTAKEFTLLRRIMIILFLAECSFSVVEWITNVPLFYVIEGDVYWLNMGFFRSTSLLGHPLANAQVVAVFMTFIAVSNSMKRNTQIFLFFLGYVSLFCFNGRGATLVVSFLTFPYFIWKLNKTIEQSKRWIIKLGLFCVCAGLLYMVTQTPLGGRLLNIEVMDDSSNTRLEVFNFYNYYQSDDDFLWGHPDNYTYMMNKLEIDGVENGIITLILEYGIIFTVPMLILLFRFQYHKLSQYPKLEKWLLLAVFYIIGTMNPNLSSPLQWLMWILIYYAFRPELPPSQTVSASNGQLS